jgi:hypothetical protein
MRLAAAVSTPSAIAVITSATRREGVLTWYSEVCRRALNRFPHAAHRQRWIHSVFPRHPSLTVLFSSVVTPPIYTNS